MGLNITNHLPGLGLSGPRPYGDRATGDLTVTKSDSASGHLVWVCFLFPLSRLLSLPSFSPNPGKVPGILDSHTWPSARSVCPDFSSCGHVCTCSCNRVALSLLCVQHAVLGAWTRQGRGTLSCSSSSLQDAASDVLGWNPRATWPFWEGQRCPWPKTK